MRELRRNKGTPEAQLSTYSYDYQGRMDGAVTPDGTYAWHYDGDRTEKSLIGKLDRESLSSESLGNSSTSYRYDGPASALSEIHRQIEGATYSTYFEHDNLGRVEIVRYPQAGDDALTAVRYHYHSEFGLVDGIYDGDDLGHALWLLEDVDAFGNPTKVRLRNKLVTTRKYEAATGLPSSVTTTSADGATTYQDERLTYDSRGLLAKRVRDGRSEYYSHDALGRLKTVGSTALGVADMVFDYDLRGNLIRKAPPVLRDTDVGELYYTDATHPHQVMETQDGRSFQYDVHGRQWLRQGTGIAAGRQEIDYTAFDLPREVRNGPDGAPTETTKYQYDASHQRIVQESSASKTKYVGDAFELTRDAQGEEHRLRIPFPDGSSVEMLVEGEEKELLFHSVDHLGSPTLVTAEGARAGVSPVRAKLAYAPFGAVDAQHSEQMDPRVKVSFTGHEHDATGLINMRGRMFDPALGRFLSADPLVQAPGFSQSWNRYSYVFNSPLGLVDPSGFEAVRTDFENGDSEVVVAETRWPSDLGGGSTLAAAGGQSANEGNDHTLQAAMNLSNSERVTLELAQGITRGAEGLKSFTGKTLDVGCGFLPGCGEYQDVEVLNDATAAKWEKGLATASLIASVFSLGFLPNYGTVRAGKEVVEALDDAADVTADVARGVDAAGDAAKVAGGLCFAAGTPVHTEGGLKPIEEVKRGDVVWAEDEVNGAIALRRVVRTFVTPDQPVVQVVLEGDDGERETIRATVEHPFWTQRGWVGARELRMSDRVLQRSGAWSQVAGASVSGERVTVYNFEVEQFHTYFVGERGVLVHNNSDIDAAAREAIAGLSSKLFRPMQCTQCAGAMADALKAKGIPGQILNITANRGPAGQVADFMVSDLVGGGGTALTQNGFHQAVRVGDMVFDNFMRQGVPYAQYVEALWRSFRRNDSSSSILIGEHE